MWRRTTIERERERESIVEGPTSQGRQRESVGDRGGGREGTSSDVFRADGLLRVEYGSGERMGRLWCGLLVGGDNKEPCIQPSCE